MKRIFMLCAGLCALMTGFAQNDSTAKQKPDTIKVGGMTIIRERGKNDNVDINDNRDHDRNDHQYRRRVNTRRTITTNWIIPDIGFSNYNDQTKYRNSDAVNAIAPGSTEDWFKLRPIHSVNFNLWLFMQRISLAKRVVNFKYGLGVEYNSYRLEDKTVRVGKNPIRGRSIISQLHLKRINSEQAISPCHLCLTSTLLLKENSLMVLAPV